MNYNTAKVSLLCMFLVASTSAWGMKRPSRELYVFKDEVKEQAIRYEKPNPKPYQCNQCIFASTHKNYFDVHQRLHEEQNHGKILLSCDDCGYLTRKTRALNEHVGTHQKESNFYCVFGTCDSSFKSMRTLKVHVKREHGDIFYEK